ncbi:uncharacterized protein E0L32_009382 [Thyridium curvatum]|uniref:CFEM domain-containing protein n=1 Tax=Thyridium curvatum TaxID=1093900 RepID=A0A507AWY5_9PEZI|nr:uncharacterized protein E0L32_009382 [Thyridium curvatum]TPX09338.1 hypothetical protein E0L32_009382 [Thyridium curvatum]
MKYTAVLLAAAAATASAQCITDIPSCAQPIIVKAASTATTCAADDFKCQCTKDNQSKITGAATADVIKACGDDVAINKVLPATQAFCAAINEGKTCSTGGGSGGSGSSSSSAASSSSSAASSSSVVSSVSSSASASATKTGMSTTTSAPSKPTGASNGTTTSKPTAVPTAGAAVLGSIGTVAMLALGALAAF